MKFIPLIFLLLMFTNLTHIKCTGVSVTEIDSALLDYDHVQVPYRFYDPLTVHKLHYDLEEISGLTYFKDDLLGAVQDESGWLFLLDARSGAITRKIKFAKSGDYECIESLGDQVYVMQSDGDLYSFTVPEPETDRVEAKKTSTNFTIKNDVEGMTMYDGQLLIMTKSSGSVKENKLKGKGAYLYDLVKDELDKKELIQLKKGDIQDFLTGKRHFSKLKDFDPSGLAVHPVLNDIYIVSADRAIVILNKEFEIKEIVKLDPGIYIQPEGICFSPDGTLYIASEGAGGRGRLIELPHQIH